MSAVSIVIPCYRSADSLEELIARVLRVGAGMRRDLEIVLVDDRSPDDTWAVLQRLKAQHGRPLRIVRLLKNSGQHNALLCGLHLAHGEIVVTMDDDLQNPPEEIPKLVAAIESGYDLAIGAYARKEHSAARNFGGDLIDRVLRGIFGLPPDFQLTSFRAARRPVVENACRMSGVHPYITAMLLSHASNQVNVAVRHDPRRHGASGYTLRRSLRLAANLILNYSSWPLYLVGALCLAAFCFSLGFGTWTFARALLHDTSVPGWASTVVIISFFNALTLLCLYVFGLYLSRLNLQITRTATHFTISEQQQ